MRAFVRLCMWKCRADKGAQSVVSSAVKARLLVRQCINGFQLALNGKFLHTDKEN